jgi:hypothetical protein
MATGSRCRPRHPPRSTTTAPRNLSRNHSTSPRLSRPRNRLGPTWPYRTLLRRRRNALRSRRRLNRRRSPQLLLARSPRNLWSQNRWPHHRRNARHDGARPCANPRRSLSVERPRLHRRQRRSRSSRRSRWFPRQRTPRPPSSRAARAGGAGASEP